eukprot:TRINITY_DN12697_c3_g1_i3.p1 TRINITY_DN12697_c3_g1~~TRINITY_DN12697_c3_g1_i3.p1  ORF type:complete len:349 (+),score=48.48 TRINITY_DN12697_c3_g1_i3:71-1117(+)
MFPPFHQRQVSHKMSLYIYNNRHPRRTYGETYMKILYLVLAMALGAAWLVSVALWMEGINEIIDGYWSNDAFKLEPSIDRVLEGCSYTAKIKIGEHDFTTTVNYSSHLYFMATAVETQTESFAVSLIAVLLSVINKVFLYRSNRWFYRFKGMVIRTNVILPTAEIVFHIWAIVAIARSFEPCSFVTDYIDSCAADAGVAEIDHNFSQPLYGLLIVLAANLFVFVIAIICVIRDSYKKENKRWVRTWYKGHHTKARKGIMKGDPDPNDEIVPPVKSIFRVLDEYPDILEGYLMRREEALRYGKTEGIQTMYGANDFDHQMYDNTVAESGYPDNNVEFSPVASNVQASEL